MREIKFRAWDKPTKRMIAEPPLSCIGIDFLEFMQFTGLHDKNGKEIYEGDFGTFSHTETLMVCEYEAPYFHWVGRDNSYSGAWDGRDIEVIGNIYENSELLDNKNV